jgi:hypothetical protein
MLLDLHLKEEENYGIHLIINSNLHHIHRPLALLQHYTQQLPTGHLHDDGQYKKEGQKE